MDADLDRAAETIGIAADVQPQNPDRARQVRTGRVYTLSRRGGWLLCQVGYLLVVAGARLEGYAQGKRGSG